MKTTEEHCPRCVNDHYGYPSGYKRLPLNKVVVLDEIVKKSDPNAQDYADHYRRGEKCDYCLGTGKIMVPVYEKMFPLGRGEPNIRFGKISSYN